MLKNHLLLTRAPPLMATLSIIPGLSALNYSNRQGNKATFETLEETRVSSPAVAGMKTQAGEYLR